MKLSLPAGLVAGLAGPPLTALARSWRIETVGEEAAWRELADRGRPYVLLSWHEALLPLIWQHRRRGITIVVSEGREGRYLEAYARRLGYGAARGSSSKGGVRALLGAVKALQGGGAAAFTPDGPRGPRRVLKDGALLAAQRGGAPLVPLHAGARDEWRLHSWDRMLVPKPFTRVRVAYGTPFQVAEGEAGLRAARELALAALARVTEEAAWHDAEAATPTA